MAEFISLSGEPRPPTWSERERLEELRSLGVEDVFLEPEQAPQEFWESLVQATRWLVIDTRDLSPWHEWEREIRWAEGWDEFIYVPWVTYVQILREGQVRVGKGSIVSTVRIRLAAVEHLLDVVGLYESNFQARVNERARWYRVGIRLEGNRFVPITSEHLHEEVVRPALVLLQRSDLVEIDASYRKAFDRALSNDPAGAITAATTAVEDMLRLGLGVEGKDLDWLTKRARDEGWIIPAVQQFIVKLSALRQESDAHTGGTDDFDVAMLALHIAASSLLYLGRTKPVSGG